MSPTNIDIIKIEREARKLRAEFTSRMIADARTWIVSKFANLTAFGTKMGGKAA